MANNLDFSIKVANYKCFGEPDQGFEKICPVNIIIGRNNAGKSSLLEIVDRITTEDMKFSEILWHKGKYPQIFCESPLTEQEIKGVFRQDRSGGEIPGNTHWSYGQYYLNKRLKWRLNTHNTLPNPRVISIEEPSDMTPQISSIEHHPQYKEELGGAKENLLKGKKFLRLLAERDITPELHKNELNITENGEGTTNTIQNYLNSAKYRREIIENTFLDALNNVLQSDAQFTRILCQKNDDDRWEIYLEEEKKTYIPLSQTGSGLKTIILVLLYINILPVIIKQDLSNCIFAFEELENNLHPALLRRLLTYLKERSERESFIVFLTTHSSTTIDFFSKNADAQIIHVTHNGEKAICQTVKTYVENRGILDDLDVRASDLLLSNGVVWVEGPSDKTYFNKWIEIWSNGELQEGRHYQCVFYGGSLLAHLSSREPEERMEAVSILRVSRNAIILMDSDRKHLLDNLKPRVQKMEKEVKQIDLDNVVPWITYGKEIENYIPVNAVESLLDKNGLSQVGQYEDFFEYVEKIEAGSIKYSKEKPQLALKVSQYLTRENICTAFDLPKRLEQVCDTIKQWNGM